MHKELVIAVASGKATEWQSGLGGRNFSLNTRLYCLQFCWSSQHSAYFYTFCVVGMYLSKTQISMGGMVCSSPAQVKCILFRSPGVQAFISQNHGHLRMGIKFRAHLEENKGCWRYPLSSWLCENVFIFALGVDWMRFLRVSVFQRDSHCTLVLLNSP